MGFTSVVYFICITEFMGLVYYHGKISLNQSEDKGYFTNRSEIAENYEEIVTLVNAKAPANIGLLISGDSYEYPLLVMLNEYDRLEHVNVGNLTGIYEKQDFVPDIIIAIDYHLPQETIVCHNNEYEITKVIAEGTYLLETTFR